MFKLANMKTSDHFEVLNVKFFRRNKVPQKKSDELNFVSYMKEIFRISFFSHVR